jgi:hypothetical protein
MLFSCKMTSSVLAFVEALGGDLNPLLDGVELPAEFLRDASYWMSASEMESFFKKACQIYQRPNEEHFLRQVGHASPELRSWGVFDSVLRMMPRPQEMLAHPEKFLASFISPPPPFQNLEQAENGIAFDLPIPTENFPYTKVLLEASLESLPVFAGQALAHCRWEDLRLTLSWQAEQPMMFGSEDVGRQISPQLLQSVVDSLQKQTLQLESAYQELQKKNEQLLKTQTELEKRVQSQLGVESLMRGPLREYDFMTESSILFLDQNLAKLQDYMVRAQQLITMLVAQDRMSPAVKAAMKKVDWERIQQSYPRVVQESREVLHQSKENNSSQRAANKGVKHV